MGQKVHPHGLRVGVIKDWDSKWYADSKNFGDSLVEDYNVRKYLKKTHFDAGVAKIEIEKPSNRLKIKIYVARPAFIIGKKGEGIEKTKQALIKMTGKNVSIEVVEIKQPDVCAQLVAENIAAQLERRIPYRKAMKGAMGRTMRLGAKGIKAMCSGRLGGAEIARSETYHEGTIPLQTIRADIDYGFAEADTTYGKIGVKVWIYKGEVLPESRKAPKAEGGKSHAISKKS